MIRAVVATTLGSAAGASPRRRGADSKSEHWVVSDRRARLSIAGFQLVAHHPVW
jgi:hypothetical protein